MEYLNEDLGSRLMPDFKFYKGSSFTRQKNGEYLTWSEILYASILKMNGATHKNIQCIHIQRFDTNQRLKLVSFLIAIINEALPHPSERETYFLPDSHIFCTAVTQKLRCCFYISFCILYLKNRVELSSRYDICSKIRSHIRSYKSHNGS